MKFTVKNKLLCLFGLFAILFSLETYAQEESQLQLHTLKKCKYENTIINKLDKTKDRLLGFQNIRTNVPFGLLFDIGNSDKLEFHMRNVHTDLVGLAYNKDKELIDSKIMKANKSFENNLYTFSQGTKYLIEIPVNQELKFNVADGYVEKNNRKSKFPTNLKQMTCE